MVLRRLQAMHVLKANEAMLTMTTFPRSAQISQTPFLIRSSLGCPKFTEPVYEPSPGADISKSLFFPDEAINKHPRSIQFSVVILMICSFPALTANIRRRRGRKVIINVPSQRAVFLCPLTNVQFSKTKIHHRHSSKKQHRTSIVSNDAQFQRLTLTKGIPMTPRVLTLHYLITFIWMRWASAWGTLVYKSLSKQGSNDHFVPLV